MRRRADALCRAAHGRLAALPPFDDLDAAASAAPRVVAITLDTVRGLLALDAPGERGRTLRRYAQHLIRQAEATAELQRARARLRRHHPTTDHDHHGSRRLTATGARTLMNRTPIVGSVAALALLAPAAAEAHVTLQPNTAVAGAYTVESVRVPNEMDDAVTTKVDVQLPHGFVAASYEAVPGWSVKVMKAKLAKPVQTDDGPIDEEVSRITFTADSRAAAIQPGQFRDFPLSMQIPGKPGDKLTFKALQTYSNGQIVRWIGPPDADEPAPQIAVLAPTAATTSTPASPPTPAATSSTSGGASKGLAIAALVLGIVGTLLGLTAVVLRRRPS